MKFNIKALVIKSGGVSTCKNIGFQSHIKNNSVITEWCPLCESEVVLDNTFKIQKCPSCKNPIKPCSMCDMNKLNCNGCKL